MGLERRAVVPEHACAFPPQLQACCPEATLASNIRHPPSRLNARGILRTLQLFAEFVWLTFTDSPHDIAKLSCTYLFIPHYALSDSCTVSQMMKSQWR